MRDRPSRGIARVNELFVERARGKGVDPRLIDDDPLGRIDGRDAIASRARIHVEAHGAHARVSRRRIDVRGDASDSFARRRRAIAVVAHVSRRERSTIETRATTSEAMTTHIRHLSSRRRPPSCPRASRAVRARRRRPRLGASDVARARAESRRPSQPSARGNAVGTTRVGRVVARARDAKDPMDFDGDYDAIRASLMAERGRGGFQPGIATTLNWLSEISFGARKTRERLGLDALAEAYGDFLDALPYRRQNGSVPGWMGARTIEETVRRAKRSRRRRGREDARDAALKYYGARETRKGFAAMATDYTMALVEDFERGFVSCETVEDSAAFEEMIKEDDLASLCERLESVAAICLCSSADAAKMAYNYPEILLTSNAVIASRLSALKLMIPGADVGLILRADAKRFLQRDIPVIKLRFRALSDAFPRVDVARLVEYDPSLLLIDVDVGLKALRELWTEEQFAQSDVDNPFFAEELALAIKTLSGYGPDQFGG